MNSHSLDLAAAIAVIVSMIRAAAAEGAADAISELVPQEPPPALLDRPGLARELGVSPSTVDRLRKEGLPVVMVCESPRFELAAVLSWLRSRRSA